jgi:hypothetical protein
MQLAIEQLRELRRANDLLSVRVDTMLMMREFLFADPPRQGGMISGEDAAWLLQRELDVLHKQEAEQKAKVAELDAILNSEDDSPATVERDGTVTAASGALLGGKLYGNPKAVKPGR